MLALGLAGGVGFESSAGGGGLPANAELVDDNLVDAELVDDAGGVAILED